MTQVDTAGSVVGVPMTLYARPKNGTTFTAVTTTTSSATGSVSAVVKPTVSTVYVWGYNGSSTLLGSRSGSLTVEVRPTITANLTAATINLGASTSFYGYMRPQHPGTTVYLQRQSGTTWPIGRHHQAEHDRQLRLRHQANCSRYLQLPRRLASRRRPRHHGERYEGCHREVSQPRVNFRHEKLPRFFVRG